MSNRVRNTPELARILALPRRTPDGSEFVEPLTELLRVLDRCPGATLPPTVHGTCSVCLGPLMLRAAQALALHDIGVFGGAFCPLGVGEGKTLITFLAPYVLDAQTPLLLLPANLIEPTERKRRELSKHWQIPSNIRLMSYEILGRVQSAKELEAYEPDLIMADECHKLKNRHAAVTRRVGRWMAEHG